MPDTYGSAILGSIKSTYTLFLSGLLSSLNLILTEIIE